MTLSSYAYGSVNGVAAYVKHLANTAGTFDTTTRPTAAEVETFIEQRSAQLNAWLAQAGYSVPVAEAATQARLVLARYANLGAAGDCELTQRSGGYSEDENKRDNKLMKEFLSAEAFITSGALSALGATQPEPPGTLAGLRVGGKTATGQRLRPVFGRSGIGNNPTAESPTAEPGWTE